MSFSAARESAIGCAAAIGTCVVLFASQQADAQSISDKLGQWLFGTYSAPGSVIASVEAPWRTVTPGQSTSAAVFAVPPSAGAE